MTITTKDYTLFELRAMADHPDNPGTIILSAKDFDNYSNFTMHTRMIQVTRTPEGYCYFDFAGTRFERKITPTAKLDLSEPKPLEEETSWVESPSVTPPVPKVRKSKKAYE